MRKTTYLLAGDIGGTYSRLGLYTASQGAGTSQPQQQLVYKEYLNEEHLVENGDDDDDDNNNNKDDMDMPIDMWFEQKILLPFVKYCWTTEATTTTSPSSSLLKSSLSPIQESVIVVCLAIAGPVRDNQVQTSRLKALEINGYDMVQRCQTTHSSPYLSAIVECYIINDFVAQGYGCLTLDTTTTTTATSQSQDVLELVPGSRDKRNPNGPIVCIGAGTGLGTCYLISTTTTTSSSLSISTKNSKEQGEEKQEEVHPYYVCLPSEFGQVEWTPRTEQDVQVWRYLKTKFNSPYRVTLEDVVSGTGLSNCYDCFASLYPTKIDDNVHGQVEQENALKGKVVAENVTNCELCHMAMTTVMRYVVIRGETKVE
jgi:glucokinase